jgi:catechol 2,3-dioxygenase-like lactoylglutathione lyase family enzyme
MKKVLAIRVLLEESDPPIWRRLEVLGETPLDELHAILQVAMGWEDYHLHCFEAGKKRYGVPDPEDPCTDERGVPLATLLSKKGKKLVYEYDYGDEWRHAIVLEAVTDPAPGVSYPRCTAGERAGPPEDAGGVWRYQEMLLALADPESEEYDEIVDWIGEGFDPSTFSVDQVNRGLARFRPKKGTRAVTRAKATKAKPPTDIGFTHVALTVKDVAASCRFYDRYAAMRLVHQRVDAHSGRRVVWLSDGTRPFVVVLIEVERVDVRLEGSAHLGVGCASRADVDRLCALARVEGSLVSPPQDSGPPVGYWAILRDPDGHHLELAFGQEVGLTVAKP